MSDLEIDYFFDPLCGWCYASAPALAALAEQHGRQLRMMPVGLFAQPRPVSAIADHAWRNDQRISGLTGQQFSEAYHHNVLQAPEGVFTSGPLTLALVALGETDPALEPRFLHAAQVARYVEGRDTSRIEEVVRVAETVAANNGVPFDPTAFSERLRTDAALKERAEARMAAARDAMRSLPGSGVPQLRVRQGSQVHTVNSEALYSGGDAVLAAVRQLAPTA